jgi:phospholipase C
MKKPFLFALLALSSIFAFAQSLPVNQKSLKKLAGVMAGEFHNNAQADADKAYFHIVLRMKPMWKESPDGYWFYVEQAVESSQHQPYRQRVYHLYLQDGSTIVSKVYELKSPQNYVGAWQHEARLAPLTADSLVDRQGCAIYLHQVEKGVYKGSTPGKECLSTLRGAVYATSEVTIGKGRLTSWDRGWNADDQQIWGADKGPYVFLKQNRLK